MNASINWLFLLPTDTLGGGAEQLLFNLVKESGSRGNTTRVVIATKKRSGEWDKLPADITVSYLPVRSTYLGTLLLLPYLMILALRTEVHAVFSSQTYLNALVGLLRRLGFFKNSKMIARESNSIYHLLKGVKLRFYDLAYRLGYNNFDLLICQSEFMKRELLAQQPSLAGSPVIVMDNPLDLKLARKRGEEEVPGLNDENYLVAAGRLVPVKGFDVLLPAFKKLKPDFPGLKLRILGEGFEEEALKAQATQLGIRDEVIFQGFVRNVYPYFRHARACVMSSRLEGFPNVLLQMMSQNVRVVSTLSAGGIENIPGIYTCPIEDEDGLSNAMSEALLADISGRREMFDQFLNARTVENYFDQVEETLNLNKVSVS